MLALEQAAARGESTHAVQHLGALRALLEKNGRKSWTQESLQRLRAGAAAALHWTSSPEVRARSCPALSAALAAGGCSIRFL